jgi:pectinesterase
MKIIFLMICFWGFIFKSNAQATVNNHKYIFTVAQDGSGEFTTIQDAIDEMRAYPIATIILYIKNGVYKEKIELPATNSDVAFIGENVDSTIITWNDFSGKGKHNTFTSYTAKISGNRFRAENITFENNAGAVGQAIALYVDADKAVFNNCKFLGNQDTIFTGGENASQLFKNCYIEGTTDFIFGPATTVFLNCIIKAKANSFITAASTAKLKLYGYVFLNCKIINTSNVSKLYLGRPWRSYAKTVFINCSYPSVIAPEGWHNWNSIDNEKTVTYAEYMNENANVNYRVKWSKQLSSNEVKKYDFKNVFGKNETWYLSKYDTFKYQKYEVVNQQIINLYENEVPNNVSNLSNQEIISSNANVTRIAKVTHPTLTVYNALKPNGKAVIVCPGGGYSYLTIQKEGQRLAKEFNKMGITAFVLKYRIPNDTFNIDKSVAPLQDAQQAIRYVRKNANLYKVDINKIGIMGSSAGGHLAATASVHYNYNADINNYDTTSCKPNFTILLYPVISFDSTISHKGSKNNLVGKNATQDKVNFFSLEQHIAVHTPPTFIVHASDDATVPVENSLRYYLACIKNKVPIEMHLYPNGGHGFGLYNKTTEDKWIDRLNNWLINMR